MPQKITSSDTARLNRLCQLADFRERGGRSLEFCATPAHRARWHPNLIRRVSERSAICYDAMRSSYHFLFALLAFARTPLDLCASMSEFRIIRHLGLQRASAREVYRAEVDLNRDPADKLLENFRSFSPESECT